MLRKLAATLAIAGFIVPGAVLAQPAPAAPEAAAPPAPVQVWQLKLSQWLMERRHLAAGTYMHSIMVDDRGIAFGKAAVAPPGPAMPQE